jgi:hypothetical protein
VREWAETHVEEIEASRAAWDAPISARGVGGHEAANKESAATGRSDAALSVAPPGLAAEGDLLGSTRTLLIQRGRSNRPNSSNLPPFPRVRVTRCWSLLGFMLDFAVLYSLKCCSLSYPKPKGFALISCKACRGELEGDKRGGAPSGSKCSRDGTRARAGVTSQPNLALAPVSKR